MVIKKLLTLVVFFLMFTAVADDKATFDLIKKMQLNLDKNQYEKVEEIYDDNEEALQNSWMALERLALSFERRDKYKEAIESYRKILVNIYPNEHRVIFNSKNEKIEESAYQKTKFPLYYYKLAFLYTQLYSKSNDYTPAAEKITYKKRAESFIQLCKKINCDEAELTMLTEQLNEKETSEKVKAYAASWYVVSDLVSWQDNVNLVHETSNSSTKLLSTSIGLLLGAGKKWQNNKYELNLEGGLIKGSSTISSADPSIEYQQSSVAVTGLYFSPGMYFKTWSESVQWGMSLPMMARKGEWKVPAGYRFEKDTRFSTGVLLQSKFKVGQFFLRTRVGKQFPNPSLFWSFGIIYDF